MLQFVLLLFFLAAISGAAAFGRLVSDFCVTRDRVTGLYIRFFITYTIMVVGVGLLSYVRVNINNRMNIERLSISLILITTGFLARHNAIWVFNSQRIAVPGIIKVLSLVNVITGILSGICIWLFPGQITDLLAAGSTITLFSVTIILTIIHPSIHPKASTSGRVGWIFAVISAAAVFAEVLFLRKYTINQGWFISMPLIYMGWNILNMASHFQPGLIPDPDQLSIMSDLFGLTPKEIEVVRCIMLGFTNHETAYELGITRSTVKNHVTNIYRKTGVSGRVNLVNLIRSDTIQDPPGPPGNPPSGT